VIYFVTIFQLIRTNASDKTCGVSSAQSKTSPRRTAENYKTFFLGQSVTERKIEPAASLTRNGSHRAAPSDGLWIKRGNVFRDDFPPFVSTHAALWVLLFFKCVERNSVTRLWGNETPFLRTWSNFCHSYTPTAECPASSLYYGKYSNPQQPRPVPAHNPAKKQYQKLESSDDRTMKRVLRPNAVPALCHTFCTCCVRFSASRPDWTGSDFHHIMQCQQANGGNFLKRIQRAG
jgi:hypothetical protein